MIRASGNSMGHQVIYVTYFRIGAASDAALRKLSDAQITMIGRGHCSVFRHCIGFPYLVAPHESGVMLLPFVPIYPSIIWGIIQSM